MVIALRQRAEARLADITLSAAALSVTHLLALYQDDVQDTLDYAGLEYQTIDAYYRPVLWESAVAYAGHGLGICEHYRDPPQCQHELARIPLLTALSVHHAPGALTLALPVFQYATSLWEPDYRHVEHFELGAKRDSNDPHQSYHYWSRVQRAVEFILDWVDAYVPAHVVMFVGEAAPKDEEAPLAKLVLETLEKVQPRPLKTLFQDADVVVAKGTAELVKRNGYLKNETSDSVSELKYGRAQGRAQSLDLR